MRHAQVGDTVRVHYTGKLRRTQAKARSAKVPRVHVFTLKPDGKQQVVVGETAGGRVFAETLPRIPLRLTTWAGNLIIRSPSMSEIFQLKSLFVYADP